MKKILVTSLTVASLGALLLVGASSIAYAQQAPNQTYPGASSTPLNFPLSLRAMPEYASGTPGVGISTSQLRGLFGNSTGTPGQEQISVPPMILAGGLGGQSSQPSLSISGPGRVQLNYGQVQSVSGSTVTVSIFGINLTVNTASAKIEGGMTSLPISVYGLNSASGTNPTPTPSPITINQGDSISLTGTIATSTGIINAATVQDLTAQSQTSTTIENRIQQLLQLISQLRSQL